jgi:hypothetical protein
VRYCGLCFESEFWLNRTLGKGIFGEGNVGFNTFEEEHECNLFCEYYGLKPFVQPESAIDKLFRSVSPPSDESLPSFRLLNKGKGKEIIEINDNGDEVHQQGRSESELEEGEIAQLSG